MAETPELTQGGITDQDRVPDTKARDVRRRLFEVVPVQRTPLTALLTSKLSKSSTTQNKYEWGETPFNTQTGDIVDVYTNSTLATAYVSGGVSRGATYYAKLALADAKQFLPGDTIIIWNGSNSVQGDVRAVEFAGASSFVAFQLVEDDTNLVLAGATLYYEVGTRSDGQLVGLPESLYQEPVLYHNYTQDIMVAMELSDREIAAKELIDPNIRARLKMQGVMRVNRYVEQMIRRGFREGPGKRTFSGGYQWWLQQKAPTNIIDLETNTEFVKTRSWKIGLLESLFNIEEKISRYNQSGEYWCLAGGLALRAIQQAIYEEGQWELSPEKTKFGVRYRALTGLNTTWNLVQDPLKSVHRNDAVKRSIDILDVSTMELREFRPLKYIPAGKNEDGYTYVNGEKSGWEWDLGFMMDNFDAHALLTNVGVDSTTVGV